MKIFVVALLLPFVACGDTFVCPPFSPVTCSLHEIMCGGEIDLNGCQMPMWCMWTDPYAHCSAKAFCPVVCPPGHRPCFMGEDHDGCPLPEMCIPEPKSTDACYARCPVNCRSDQMMCGGAPDDNGCPMPMWCLNKDEHCPTNCPAECGPGMMSCSGGLAWDGCPLPDTCIPMGKSTDTCPTFCPAPCVTNGNGMNQGMCGGEPDANGCATPNWCIDIDHTALCFKGCPTTCPPDMIPCYEGQDSWGCEMPMSCHKMEDGCPPPPKV